MNEFKTDAKPHVLLLFADQLRADFTSAAGYPVVRAALEVRGRQHWRRSAALRSASRSPGAAQPGGTPRLPGPGDGSPGPHAAEEHFARLGANFKARTNRIAAETGVPAACAGVHGHPGIRFHIEDGDTAKKVVTLFIQENARRGLILSTASSSTTPTTRRPWTTRSGQ